MTRYDCAGCDWTPAERRLSQAAVLEERAATKQHRNLERARKAAEQQRAKARRQAMRAAIAESRELAPHCRCELTPDLDNEQLKALGSGCQTRFVCPCLLGVRRRMGL